MNAIRRLLGAASLAAVIATGFAGAANATLPAPGEGIVLVSLGTPDPVEAAQSRFKRGKFVDFAGNYAPGSIIVVTKQHALYFVLGNGKAVKYRVATAKKGFEWSGAHHVSRKQKWADWRPPVEMRQRRPELPDYMAGGPENPLGARTIYLGDSIYRIHGTNEPSSIGKSASSGCIRMLNADVMELYPNVKTGALVVVM
jgi:lipoprotein-anchoring transpeptidase ErfK/SrfK